MTDCKVCGSQTELQGFVDLGRSCEINNKKYLTGIQIEYNRCMNCKFIFTNHFDDWSIEDFNREIYNNDYINVDPDYNGKRAEMFAPVVIKMMNSWNVNNVLDYGGGNGKLAEILRQNNYNAKSWDVMNSNADEIPEESSFDLVTAFEVFEHTPTPKETLKQVLSFLKPKGRLLFSTLTLDNLPRHSTDHWYIAPRNGHISIHTTTSLRHLVNNMDCSFHSYNESLHKAERISF